MKKLLLLSFLFLQVSAQPLHAESGRSGQVLFDTAEDALAGLKAALKAEDSARLTEIYGKRSKDIFFTGDPVGDAVALRNLSRKFDQRAELLAVTSDEYSKEQWYLIRYGIEGWDMHVPLVNRGKGWEFATEYATDADLKVRKSLNEVATVDTLRALTKAQKEYKAMDTDDDGVYEYAHKFISSPGKQDGLYWPATDGNDKSPIGGLVARALQDGYKPGKNETPTYYGYIYKMLYAQGGKTRGGKKSYLKNSRLTEGFAILAYPVKWNSSGRSTFVVGADGNVWKRDFDSRTGSIAPDIESMNLDQYWYRVDPVLGGKNSRSNWK
jgi:hypothetical protein